MHGKTQTTAPAVVAGFSSDHTPPDWSDWSDWLALGEKHLGLNGSRNVFLRAKPTRFGSVPSGSMDGCISQGHDAGHDRLVASLPSYGIHSCPVICRPLRPGYWDGMGMDGMGWGRLWRPWAIDYVHSSQRVQDTHSPQLSLLEHGMVAQAFSSWAALLPLCLGSGLTVTAMSAQLGCG